MSHHQSKDRYQQEADGFLQKLGVCNDEAGAEPAADATRNVAILLSGSEVGKVRVHRYGSDFIHSPETPNGIDYATFESINPAYVSTTLSTALATTL